MSVPEKVTPDASLVADDIRELHRLTLLNAEDNYKQGFYFSSMVLQSMRYHVIAQCNPDLLIQDCKTCLDQAFSEPCEPQQCGAFSSMLLVLYPSCQYMYGYEWSYYPGPARPGPSFYMLSSIPRPRLLLVYVFSCLIVLVVGWRRPCPKVI